jgi:signal transduction histidine kinase
VRATLVLAVAASVALGVLAEGAGLGWDDPVLWIPDLLVGWTLLASAILAWWLRGAAAVSALLAAGGVTWFLGFTPETLYWHRGPVVHLLLTYPGWRPRGPVGGVAVGVGYLAAVVPGLWGDPAVAVLLSVGLVAACAQQSRTATTVQRPARRTALGGSALLAAAVITASVLPAVVGLGGVPPSLLAYQAALAAVAVMLVVRLPSGSASALTDAVVDLAEQPDGSLPRRLASALADPTVEVAFWSPTTRDYRTETGLVVDPDAPGSGRAVVVVAREGRPLAAVIHDAQSLRDPRLVDALTRAVRLSDTNAALRARVEEVYWQVFDSRRRLVVAGDEERRRLDTRLRRGPERMLRQLEVQLAALDDHDGAVARAREHCREAQVDLRRLSQGLHPRELDEGGLVEAVRALARRQPGGIQARVDADPLPAGLPPDVAATGYFVVAEALANVAKHAGGDQVRIELHGGPGWLRVSVSDDGVGGAIASGGTGLQGLADRVAALGGGFEVRSPPGVGTRVTAELPVESAR